MLSCKYKSSFQDPNSKANKSKRWDIINVTTTTTKLPR